MQNAMSGEVAAEVGRLSRQYTELYTEANDAVVQLKARVAALEMELEGKEKDGEGSRKKSLISMKQMLPSVMTKEEEWRSWKSDMEDYCEEGWKGMKGIMEEVRKAEDEVNDDWTTE